MSLPRDRANGNQQSAFTGSKLLRVNVGFEFFHPAFD